MSPRHVLVVAGLCLAGYGTAAEQVQVRVLPTFDVAPSNINSFNTPVAYWQGDVYTANVEPGMGMPGIHLKTVVRKCALGSAAACVWESKVVDDATLDDMYHTQPSIAVDRAGYVHVAYNMHHMPWQYSVSTKPRDILAFKFLGEPITTAEKAIVKLANKTPFFSIGKAAIAGNQITYPAFYYDRNRDLYVTYRFATRPKLAFADRAYAGGIAAYDVVKKQWSSIGGNITVSVTQAELPDKTASAMLKAFAFTNGWQALPIRLYFDKHNGMHAAWSWREHKGGSEYTRASYAYSPDKGETFNKANGYGYTLPIDMDSTDAPFSSFGATPSLLADADLSVFADLLDQPYVVAVPKGQPSQMSHFSKTSQRWVQPEPMPLNARRIEIDDEGRQWVFTAGLKVLRRGNGQKEWTQVYEDKDVYKYGWPKVYSLPSERLFVVHTGNVQLNKVKIYLINY